jgi:hypothetical protein
MTTFLFWNVQRKQLDTHIVDLAKNHSVDVLLLLEHPKPDIALFQLLNKVRPYQPVKTHNRFGVYVSFNSTQMVRVTPPTTAAADRADFWDVRVSNKNRLFLALVHGLDIINYSAVQRSLFFERLRTDIEWMEENDAEVKHKQTVVLGDFNANPFDDVIGSTRGLHAIRLKSVGGKLTRSVLGVNYRFFCNPMWSCFRGWERSPPRHPLLQWRRRSRDLLAHNRPSRPAAPDPAHVLREKPQGPHRGRQRQAAHPQRPTEPAVGLRPPARHLQAQPQRIGA